MNYPLKKIIAWCAEDATSNYPPFLRITPRICRVCGRSTDKILSWIEMFPVYSEERQAIEYVCLDHGNQFETLWNCQTGEEVKLKHFPEWLRRPRNLAYRFLIQFVIGFRFMDALKRHVFYLIKYRRRALAVYDWWMGTRK